VSDIRVAITGNASALAILEERSSVASLGHLFGPHPYPSGDVLARWTLVLQDPDVTVLGAWDGDALVGFAASDPVSLRHFGVSPERFGTGLADELHGHVVERWRAAGTTRAKLWVLAQNTRARRFYERHGWTADGRAQESQWPPYPVEVGHVLDVSTG
jgi:GNAT superfamily N-acetyltransferase